MTPVSSVAMRVEEIDTPAGFDAIRADWDAVHAADPEAHFFLSSAWMTQAFARIGGGCRVLAVRPDAPGAACVAFLPLRVGAYFSKSRRQFCNELLMPGLAIWADYSGLLCHPDHEEQALVALAERLQQLPWAQLELRNLLISDQRLEILLGEFDDAAYMAVARERGPNRDGIDNDTCPFVDLPATFDQFLGERLSANTRQKLRRFLRKVESSDEWRITENDAQSTERDIDILIGFWRATWATHKGKHIDRLAASFRTILRGAAEAGFLYLPVLWRGDHPVGAMGHFVDRRKGCLLFKVAGRDPACEAIPPGLVLHGHSIRHAIGQGMRRYDFLRGNEPYKYSYGAADRRLRNITIQARVKRNRTGSLDPLGVEAVLRQCVRYEQKGAFDKAEAGCRQVLAIAPQHAVALFLLRMIRDGVRHEADTTDPAG